MKINLVALPGEFIYKSTLKPYVGPYHIHADGTYMIGKGVIGMTHNLKPQEVIVRT